MRKNATNGEEKSTTTKWWEVRKSTKKEAMCEETKKDWIKKLDEWSELEESDGHRKYPGRDRWMEIV